MLNDRMLRAAALWERGLAVAEIAERMRVAPGRVRRDLRELGIFEGKGEGGEAAVGAGGLSGAAGAEVSREAEEADRGGSAVPEVRAERGAVGC